jgi:Protein of unknown function (DUF3500)
MLKKISITAIVLSICIAIACNKDTSITPTLCETPSGTSKDCSNLKGIDKVICLSENLKAELCAAQQSTIQLDYTAANAKKWSNLPVSFVPRLGMRLGDMNAKQLAAAKALIQEIMGASANEGFAEYNQLLAADEYLFNNGGGNEYGKGQYYIAFLGTPSAIGAWQIQTGGHHLAVSVTYKNGVMTGATPSFRAVEPFAAFSDNSTNVQPMLQEQKALSAILTSLSATELANAKLSTSFSDILLGPGKDGQFPTAKLGLKIGTLTTAQKTLILDAIKSYVNDVADIEAAKILATYTSELNETYISYSGTTGLTTKGDYIRIDGPNVWIEYSSQGGIVLSGQHPHSVWRDRKGDYGGNF